MDAEQKKILERVKFMFPPGTVIRFREVLERKRSGETRVLVPKDLGGWRTGYVSGWRYCVEKIEVAWEWYAVPDSPALRYRGRRLVLLVREGWMNREVLVDPGHARIPASGRPLAPRDLPVLRHPMQDESYREWMREVMQTWQRDKQGRFLPLSAEKEMSHE